MMFIRHAAASLLLTIEADCLHFQVNLYLIFKEIWVWSQTVTAVLTNDLAAFKIYFHRFKSFLFQLHAYM